MSSVILLNGPSSSGKSTLARELQSRIETPFWHVSSDQFVSAKLFPERRDERGPFSWPVMRPKFFDGFHRSLPAFADAGNDLIVEHVIEFDAWFDDLVRLLSEHDVFFVGVHCQEEELARRELARGDRYLGEAIEHLREGVHRRGPYDFEVDTTDHEVASLAGTVIHQWRARSGESVFRSLF